MILKSNGYMKDYDIKINPNDLLILIPEYLKAFAKDYPNDEPSWDSFKAYLIAHKEPLEFCMTLDDLEGNN